MPWSWVGDQCAKHGGAWTFWAKTQAPASSGGHESRAVGKPSKKRKRRCGVPRGIRAPETEAYRKARKKAKQVLRTSVVVNPEAEVHVSHLLHERVRPAQEGEETLSQALARVLEVRRANSLGIPAHLNDDGAVVYDNSPSSCSPSGSDEVPTPRETSPIRNTADKRLPAETGSVSPCTRRSRSPRSPLAPPSRAILAKGSVGLVARASGASIRAPTARRVRLTSASSARARAPSSRTKCVPTAKVHADKRQEPAVHTAVPTTGKKPVNLKPSVKRLADYSVDTALAQFAYRSRNGGARPTTRSTAAADDAADDRPDGAGGRWKKTDLAGSAGTRCRKDSAAGRDPRA